MSQDLELSDVERPSPFNSLETFSTSRKTANDVEAKGDSVEYLDPDSTHTQAIVHPLQVDNTLNSIDDGHSQSVQKIQSESFSYNIIRSKELIEELEKTTKRSSEILRRVRLIHDSQKLLESCRELNHRHRCSKHVLFRRPVPLRHQK